VSYDWKVGLLVEDEKLVAMIGRETMEHRG
jgi:hypothetical protein